MEETNVNKMGQGDLQAMYRRWEENEYQEW